VAGKANEPGVSAASGHTGRGMVERHEGPPAPRLPRAS